jgi:hypothetical protein
MNDRTYTGTEWSEAFFVLVGALWLLGALAFGTLVMLGAQRAGISPEAASNQTPVAESPQTE